MAIIGISGKIGSGKDTIGKIIQYLTYCNLIKESISYEEYFNRKPGGYHGLYQIKKYAGKLKQIVSILTGIRVEDLEEQEVKDRVLGKEWWYYEVCRGGDMTGDYEETIIAYPDTINKRKEWDEWNLIKPTVRQMLQLIGTEAMRDVIHPNCWVNALFADYKQIIVGYAPGNYWCKCGECNKQFTGDKRAVRCEKCSIFYPNWIITDVRFPNEVEAIKNRDGIIIRVNRNDKVSTIVEKQEGQLVSINHRSETILDNVEFDYLINNDSTIEQLIEKVKEILIKEKII